MSAAFLVVAAVIIVLRVVAAIYQFRQLRTRGRAGRVRVPGGGVTDRLDAGPPQAPRSEIE